MPACLEMYTKPDVSFTNSTVSLELTKPQTEYSSILIASELQYYWINSRIHDLIYKFGSLEDNWDGYDALAPTDKVIDLARHLTTFLSKIGVKIYNTAPGPNGEIMLDLRNDKNSLELIIYDDRTMLIKFPYHGTPSQSKLDHLIQITAELEWLYKS